MPSGQAFRLVLRCGAPRGLPAELAWTGGIGAARRPRLHATLRGGEAGRSKVKGQKANVKSDGILPFDLCDLHFDPLPLPPQGVQHVAELLEGLRYTQRYEAAKRAGQKSKVKRQM